MRVKLWIGRLIKWTFILGIGVSLYFIMEDFQPSWINEDLWAGLTAIVIVIPELLLNMLNNKIWYKRYIRNCKAKIKVIKKLK